MNNHRMSNIEPTMLTRIKTLPPLLVKINTGKNTNNTSNSLNSRPRKYNRKTGNRQV